MALVGRLIVIGVGFLVASLVAGGFVTAAALYPQVSELYLDGGYGGRAFHDRFYLTFNFFGLFVSGFALLPAMVLALIAENFSLRSLLFYVLGGAAVGLAVYLSLNAFDPVQMLTVADRRELEIVIGGGVLGGLAYWLIAGRNAGRWRERRPDYRSSGF